MQWEYCTIIIDRENVIGLDRKQHLPEPLEDFLKRYGEGCWELVSVNPSGFVDGSLLAIFKRPK